MSCSPNTSEREKFAALEAFAKDLERRQGELRVKRRSWTWKPTATSASQLGYRCERRIVYQRVTPWAAQPINAELASIFEEGEHHEKQVIRELEDDLGLKIRERQASFRDTRHDIVGVIDLEAFVPGVGWVPTEVKSTSFLPGDDVDGLELAEGNVQLHRRYFAQLLTYMLLRSQFLGLFIFKSRVTGRWRCIAISLIEDDDYRRAETLLKRAERVRDAVRAFVAAFDGVMNFRQEGPADLAELIDGPWAHALAAGERHLPERIPDRSECPRCPFLKTCRPSDAPIDPALLIDDADVIEQCTKLLESKPAHSGYKRGYKALKGRFDLTGGTLFFAGPFKIEKRRHGKGWKLMVENQQDEKGKRE